VRLRRERVHGLRACDARDRLHRERDDAACRQALDALRVGERGEEADQHRSRCKLRNLLRARPADPDDRLGVRKELATREDVRTGRFVLGVREAGKRTRALLDSDREAGADEPPDRVGDERYPALAGFGLFRDDDSHEGATLRKREGNGQPLWKPSSVGSLLATFSTALEARDPYLRGHSARVTAFAEALAVALGWTGRRLDTLR